LEVVVEEVVVEEAEQSWEVVVEEVEQLEVVVEEADEASKAILPTD